MNLTEGLEMEFKMARNRSTDRNDNNFDEATIEAVW